MTPINMNHLELESQCISQLGNFSKLPTDVRLLIWEALFPDSRNRPSPRKYRRALPPTKLAPILCISRFIYHEISTMVYRNLRFCFIIHTFRSIKTWIKFKAISGKLHICRSFKTAETAETYLGKFKNFPFARVPRPEFEIQIEGSNHPDEDIVVHQFLKGNFIADFLDELPTPPHVHVRLLKNWLENGSPRKSPCITTLGSKENQWADHEIILLPFIHFENWHFTFPPELKSAILKSLDVTNQAELHLYKEENTTASDRVDGNRLSFELARDSPGGKDETSRVVMKLLDDFNIYIGHGNEGPSEQMTENFDHDKIWESAWFNLSSKLILDPGTMHYHEIYAQSEWAKT